VKVVIDTDILVSAPSSEAIMAEYLRVFAYPKFRLTEEEIRHLLEREILPWFEPVMVQEGELFVMDDPDDDNSSGAPHGRQGRGNRFRR